MSENCPPCRKGEHNDCWILAESHVCDCCSEGHVEVRASNFS